jgi:glucosamine-6-phosphate deaminase
MQVKAYLDRATMSRAAAQHAVRALRDGIDRSGIVRMIAATGTSQLEFLEALTTERGIEWGRVEMFHLDEYVGISIDHPASFRRYLLDRLIVRTGIVRYHLLDGEREPARVADEVGRELITAPVDVAFIGIGENGHLAFNDPPADFETERPYLVVTLDERCRRQQVGEGWFASVRDVPPQAITMSVGQILKSREIICIVPDARKSAAVAAAVEGEITPMTPASILRTHPNTTLYLDRDSAAGLHPALRGPLLETDSS